MQKKIHPQWNNQATVTCACGNTFTTGSVSDSIQLDICNKCHPFFTGEEKFVDTQGRVEKFMKKMAAAKAKQATNPKKKAGGKQNEDNKTYQQLLAEQKVSIKKQEKTETV